MTCMPAAVHEVAGAEAGAPDQCREQSPPGERKGVPEELSLRPPCPPPLQTARCRRRGRRKKKH